MKTIVLVCDDVSDHGNGTSNSACQFASELQRRGFDVRLVGVGAPEFAVREEHIPLVTFLAHKQRMRIAHADRTVLAQALEGADLVHVYLPFRLERLAVHMAHARHIPVTAGFHLMPENVLYSAGMVGQIPWLRETVSSWLYRLFWKRLYRFVSDIHVPSRMGKVQLLKHHYTHRIHVFSNGVNPRFTASSVSSVVSPRIGVSTDGLSRSKERGKDAPEVQVPEVSRPIRIITSGRLAGEKDYDTLLRALAVSKHRDDLSVLLCGTGPRYHHLLVEAAKYKLKNVTISYLNSQELEKNLRGSYLFVHPALVELESLSVLEALACGAVPVIAQSPLSAASQFALHARSLFPARDVRMLAEQIDWWCDHPEVHAEYSSRYAQMVREEYSLSASVDAFLAMAESAIATQSDSN